jgi:hypothetical protein
MSSDPIRAHLIWSFFVESTGIVEVFRVLFKSFLVTDGILKLNRKDDKALIELLKTTLNNTFPFPSSSITPDLENLRYNAYWRLFGYVIKGKESYLAAELKPTNYNADFNSMFEKIMYEIFQGVLDKQITIEKLANPSALAQLLNDLRRQLQNRTYNEIEDIAELWYANFSMLRLLLNDDTKNHDLMVKRLNIRSTGEDKRLIELGEKLNVPVATTSLYLFILADKMQEFLKRIEDTDWTPEEAVRLFDEETNFKEISSAWYQVTGKDFLADALAARRRPATVVTSPPPA